MTSKGRYLRGQKNSDRQIEHILLGYAEGLTAAAFIRRSKTVMRDPPASRTVYLIYRLLRKRISKFPYPTGNFWFEAALDDDSEIGALIQEIYHSLDPLAQVTRQVKARRGLTAGNYYEMLGEFQFRAHYSLPPMIFLHHIKRVVRITGRLNEPMRNESQLLHELDILSCRFFMNYARTYFAGDAASIAKVIEHHENHITIVRRQMRRAYRRSKSPA